MSPKVAIIILLTVISLAACKESPDTAIPRLVKELRSSESSERNKAALALASYGSSAAPAVKPLKSLLKDENNGVRSSAAYALRSIGTPEANKILENYEK